MGNKSFLCRKIKKLKTYTISEKDSSSVQEPGVSYSLENPVVEAYPVMSMEEALKNGMTLDFPAVGNRVADWLYSRRMSIRAALPEMPFGTRAELQRWRALCAKMFESVMGKAS